MKNKHTFFSKCPLIELRDKVTVVSIFHRDEFPSQWSSVK